MGKLWLLPKDVNASRGCRSRRWMGAAWPAALCLLLAMAGCKTDVDAKAAAAQLTATAQTLSEYYGSLDTLLAQTDQINTLRALVNSNEPYSETSRKYLAQTRAEIQKRQGLAAELSQVAVAFAQLSGSTGSSDLVQAAGNLQEQLQYLNLNSKVRMAAGQLQLMDDALGLIVSAVKQHREREAARQIDAFSGHLEQWFEKEEPYCNSIGANYAQASASLAHRFVNTGQIEPSLSLDVALHPYGIAPHVTDGDLLKKLAAQADAQIDAQSQAIATRQADASKAMQQALDDMSKRMHALATDKAMSFRMAPPSLADVQSWINSVPPISSIVPSH